MLILVKHSLPAIDPDRPAHAWRLSDEGRRRCEPLADRLAAYRPDRVIVSLEPKATATGRIVAQRLGLLFETALDLHEHDRSNVGFLSAEQFEAAVAEFFARPGELVLGRETADEAHARFARAVAGILSLHAGETLVVVAHGTVISLFVARAAGLDPYALWKRLGLPSFIALSTPHLSLQEVVHSTDAPAKTHSALPASAGKSSP